MSQPTFKLNTGASIPAIALGTWRSTEEEGYNAVIAALKAGYRHIDTAYVYGNEVQVGKLIKDSGVPREELFITTKLWCTDHTDPEKAIKRSLELLQLDYVDLYLMHWPVALNPNGNDPKFPTKPDGSRDRLENWDFVKSWELMQTLVEKKYAAAIGVSNFSAKNLEILLLLPTTKIVPLANQVELHPYLPQPKLLEYCASKNIILEAYCPLGSADSPLFGDPTLQEIAAKYDVSTATIMISWAVWRKTVVLPKSITPKRIESNFVTVKLSDEDGEKINQISTILGKKRVCAPDWGVTVFNDEDDL